MNKHQQQQQLRTQPSQPHLEEILQDPNTKWSDIRSAMKAHGQAVCTNAALMRALSSEIGPSGALSDHDAAPITELPTVLTNSAATTSTNRTAIKSSVESRVDHYEDEAPLYEDSFVETYRIPLASDASHTNKPVPRLTRRNSKVSSSSLASIASVNLMDFGVDHFAGIEVESYESINASNRSGSLVSDYSCDSDGFMGWKQDNDEASTKSNMTNLSRFCDSEGFLTWELSASARIAKASAFDKDADSIGSSDLENEGIHSKRKPPQVEDCGGFNDSVFTVLSNDYDPKNLMNFLSLVARRKATASEDEEVSNSVRSSDLELEFGQAKRKSWRIEDYEGFNDSVPTILSADSKNSSLLSLVTRRRSSGDFGSAQETKESFWKKYVPLPNSKTPQAPPVAQTVELDDVRQALMNVRKCSNKPMNISKRDNQAKKEPSEIIRSKLEGSFQQLLLGISAEADNSTTYQQGRRPPSIISSSRSNEGKESQYVTKSCPFAFSASANDDTRDAIWINRSDGDVDIEKECRKLYLESSEQLPKQRPKSRRSSFFIGEIPKSIFKKDQDDDFE
ncbi:hypothetical protein ACHAW6_005182 [Cyclotella cf. meneghiniana]